MTLQNLNDLTQQDRSVVVQMIEAVVEHPDIHVNRFRVHRVDQFTFEYFVGLHTANTPSPVLHRFTSGSNLATLLVRRGLATSSDHEGWYSFTDEACAWYRDQTAPTNHAIQRRIGRALQERYESKGGPPDVEALASALGITLHRLQGQIRLLSDLGYVRPPMGAYTPDARPQSRTPGDVFLTKEKGLAWANAGCPPIGPDGSAAVNVTVHVTLQQTIQSAEQLPISQQDKERFELLLHRLEAESEKDEPSYTPVKDVLQMSANVKELAPLAIRFLGEHLDTITRMVRHIPNL